MAPKNVQRGKKIVTKRLEQSIIVSITMRIIRTKTIYTENASFFPEDG